MFDASPQFEGEANKTYFNRLSAIYGRHWTAIETAFYRGRRNMSMVTTHQVLQKGEVVSQKQSLLPEPTPIPKGHVVVGTSVFSNGNKWVKTARSGIYDIPVEDIEEAVNSYVSSLNWEPMKIEVKPSGVASILVYTDVHVGMDVEHNSTFGGSWNEEALEQRRIKMVEQVISNCSKSSHIVIVDLGDFVDGYEGYTTRGGHVLPQNMDTEEAFRVGSNFKLNLIRDLRSAGFSLETHTITNDNHSGAFGYLVSYHVGKIAEAAFGIDKNFTYRKFINHFIVGKHCFILTHGKDRKSRKFGFPLVQDKKAMTQISDYIDHHRLYDYHIHFMKGDSHQALFDFSNQRWDYLNYPCLSPASAWVQENFTKGRSGFVIHTFSDSEKAIEVKPYFF